MCAQDILKRKSLQRNVINQSEFQGTFKKTYLDVVQEPELVLQSKIYIYNDNI